jgi:protoporphyrinogen/coproporphyrinogen III oxidase
MTRPTLAIIGGGISGLATALFALEEERWGRVVVLEASGRFGGLIHTHREGGFLMEEGADTLSRTRPAAIVLCHALGISLEPAKPVFDRAQVVLDGRLADLPDGAEMYAAASYWPLVASPLLRWADPELRRGGPDLESTTGTGRRGEHSEQLEGLFVTPVGGMQALVDAAVDGLKTAELRRSWPVRRLDALADRWLLTGPRGDLIHADAVVVALPLPATVALTHIPAPDLSRELASIRSLSTLSVNMIWRRADLPEAMLQSSGFVVPEREGRLISWCSMTSELWPGRGDAEHAALRVLARGGPEILDLDDEEAFLQVWAELVELTGIRSAPRYRHIARHAWAVPDFSEAQSRRLWAVQQEVGKLRGLALAGSVWRGPGVSNVVEAATQALLKLRAEREAAASS